MCKHHVCISNHLMVILQPVHLYSLYTVDFVYIMSSLTASGPVDLHVQVLFLSPLIALGRIYTVCSLVSLTQP